MLRLLPNIFYWYAYCGIALICLGMGNPSLAPHEEAYMPTNSKPIRIDSRFVSVAQSQIGVQESPLNSNRGPVVDKYNLTCGKDFLGAPWCASFARWIFYQVGMTNGIPGAYSPNWYKKEKRIEIDNIQPGDQGLIYFPSLGRYAHVIACVETVKMRGSKVVEVGTIEGNTNPSGGREGYGVFRRVRQADSITFIRWN